MEHRKDLELEAPPHGAEQVCQDAVHICLMTCTTLFTLYCMFCVLCDLQSFQEGLTAAWFLGFGFIELDLIF